MAISRYAVIPLSPNAGLVGWVPNCDTLHDLIRSYRERKKIMLNVENKLIQQLAPNNLYDSLSLMQKIEVFEYSMKNTSGEDLHKILWYQSNSSEAWLLRRNQFTKSLAVMSVVGYVLGLGDRHPSNLMLERSSGRIIHIDFGDCFEVAMHREKYPETIPFRLTRMLVMAMEVSGIEGSYRLTCERTMKVMREHKDSLIATLEAFVHDPLISWRVLNANRERGAKGPEQDGGETAREASRETRHESQEKTSPRRLEPVMEDSQTPVEKDSGGLKHFFPEVPSTDRTERTETSDRSPRADSAYISEEEDAEDDERIADFSSAETSPRIASYHPNLHLDMQELTMSVHKSEEKMAKSSVRSRPLPHHEEDELPQEEVIDQAVVIINRVIDKLTGLDFHDHGGIRPTMNNALKVPDQIDRLIKQATANENLCTCFFGWCAFW